MTNFFKSFIEFSIEIYIWLDKLDELDKITHVRIYLQPPMRLETILM